MGEEHKSLTNMMIADAEKGKSLEELLQNAARIETVSELIHSKLGEMTLDDLGYEIGLSYAGISKIVSEKIRPKRDILLAIAFVLKMNIEEAQQLLKSGRHAGLTSSDQRDITIIHGKVENLSLTQMNQVLLQHDFKPLTSDVRTF